MYKKEKVELKRIFNDLRRGNQTVIKELYEKYKEYVCKMAYSILKNEVEAESVAQIVFLKLYSLFDNKLPKDKEISWLYSFVKNETIIFSRKNKDCFDLEKIYNIEDADEITNIIDKSEYNNLMKKLKPKVREIVSLKLLSKFSFSQIGQMLDTNTIFIRINYYRAVCFNAKLN